MSDIEIQLEFSGSDEIGNYGFGANISYSLEQFLNNKTVIYKNGNLYIKRRYGRGGYYTNYYKVIKTIPKIDIEILYNQWRILNE